MKSDSRVMNRKSDVDVKRDQFNTECKNKVK